MLIDFKQITTLCLITLCPEKQVIWTYQIFLYSFHLLSKSVVFTDIFEEFYIFAVILDPFQTSFLAPYILNTLC